ncbi:hypothetical protein CYLTODRAFT_426564 [Cylindrobasidium torrendii FP15055 ss-10]|uniref:F-box domain-containing protein n=1 Tax=Cylindrobasidium torrendii FP15055 ss-10 TaxID=1314674 RepID=A0A0D7AY36_9AGAR|nr:hypothetical protein CYLTODRAFT_426564 [Cylindrobasidium torrendii FP15055 ss-10]
MGTEPWDLCPEEQCSCANHRLPTHNEDILQDDARVKSLIASNEIPLESTKDELDSLLLSLKDRMASRDALAKRLRCLMEKFGAALTALEEERDQLQAAITHGQHAFSIVKRVPVEVLQHIFQYTITFPPAISSASVGHELSGGTEDVDAEPSEISPWCDRVQLDGTLRTLKQVSRGWRAVVLSSTALHSSLSVHISSPHFATPRHMSLLQQHLSRSGVTPLSVAITCEPMEMNRLAAYASTLAEFLMPYAARVVELHVFLPDKIAGEFGRLQLTSLASLFMHNTPRAREIAPPHYAFVDCPLRRLVLRDYANPCIAQASSRTWEHVTHLELLATSNTHIPSVQKILQVLYLTRGHLRTAIFHVDSDCGGQVPNAVCRQLKTLTIKRHDTFSMRSNPEPLQRLIENITFPVLESLSIETPEPMSIMSFPGDTFASVLVAIDRSSAPLKALRYSHGDCRTLDLRRLAQVARDLETLVVQTDIMIALDPSRALDFINLFVAGPEEEVPFPRLQRLGTSMYPVAKGNEFGAIGLFVEMVRQRWAAGALRELNINMRGVQFEGSEDVRTALEDGMEEFVAEGLTFTDGPAGIWDPYL